MFSTHGETLLLSSALGVMAAIGLGLLASELRRVRRQHKKADRRVKFPPRKGPLQKAS
jgi:hypothetical protein